MEAALRGRVILLSAQSVSHDTVPASGDFDAISACERGTVAINNTRIRAAFFNAEYVASKLDLGAVILAFQPEPVRRRLGGPILILADELNLHFSLLPLIAGGAAGSNALSMS